MTKRRLVLFGVLLLLLADVALVFLALRPRTQEAPMPLATDIATAVSGPTSPVGTDGGSTAAATATGPATAPAGVALAAVDAKVAWRATMGNCADGGATLEITTDGGVQWTGAKAPTPAIARVQPQEGTSGFVVGADKGCALQEYGTTDNGTSWADPTPVDGGWARSLKDTSTVVTPKEDAARPCGDAQVIDLARGSATGGQALCADGDVKLTTDGGTTWKAAGTALGGVALASRVEGGELVAFVARIDAKCEGVQIVRAATGAEAKVVACVAVDGPVAPGSVGFSAPPKAGWMVVGDNTWVSGADLKTWKKA